MCQGKGPEWNPCYRELPGLTRPLGPAPSNRVLGNQQRSAAFSGPHFGGSWWGLGSQGLCLLCALASSSDPGAHSEPGSWSLWSFGGPSATASLVPLQRKGQ